MTRIIKRKNKKMASKTLSKKKVRATVRNDWPLTEKDYLINLTAAEVAKLSPEVREALADYKAGRLRPIEELFEELRAERVKKEK
jgi:uncharacterized protein HemX